MRHLIVLPDLNAEEQSALDRLLNKVVEFASGQELASEGDQPSFTTVLLDGIACRCRQLPNGSRQIMTFNIPGDWIDINSFFLKTLDHSIHTLTRCKVAQVPHTAIRELIEAYPRIGQNMWRNTMVEGAVVREWVVNIGRRDAYERVAHLLCELHARLEAIGMTDGYRYELPLTQTDLADSVGVSTVHVNRVLQKLRHEGLISFGGKSVVIHDWDRLREVGDFAPNYLHLNEGPAHVRREPIVTTAADSPRRA